MIKYSKITTTITIVVITTTIVYINKHLKKYISQSAPSHEISMMCSFKESRPHLKVSAVTKQELLLK